MIFGTSRKTLPRLRVWTGLALLLLSLQASRAAEGPQDLAAVLSALRQDSTATADFVERRSLAYLTEPLVVAGRLTYSPGGRLERQVTRPKPETMIIDGPLLTIEQNPKDPPIRVLLEDYPPLQAFVSALRALLAGDRTALETTFESDFESSGTSWRLTLTPKAVALADAIDAIEVAGKAGSLRSLEIAERNGNRTLVEIQPRP